LFYLYGIFAVINSYEKRYENVDAFKILSSLNIILIDQKAQNSPIDSFRKSLL